MSVTTTSSAQNATANLANITRTADAQAAAAAAKGSTTMGKSDFLALFTAQLKNQDPTDPVKNEAFVAQLAQFSQLEATTNMASALTTLSATIQGDRMMGAAGLIGRAVTAPGLPANLSGGNPVTGSIALPNGASAVQMDIYDAKGTMVRTLVAGALTAGNQSFTWDGLDNNGKALPDGAYLISAKATVAGKNSIVPVNMTSTIQSVSVDPATKEVTIVDQSGTTLPLSSVISFGG